MLVNCKKFPPSKFLIACLPEFMNLLYAVKYVKHVDSAYALAGRGGVTCQVCAVRLWRISTNNG